MRPPRIDRADRVGSLEVGKQLDAVVIDGALPDLLRVGSPVIAHVIKSGKRVVPPDVRDTEARNHGARLEARPPCAKFVSMFALFP